MGLTFKEDGFQGRQWLFNLGQTEEGSEQWTWTSVQDWNNVQIGTWYGNYMSTITDLTIASTLATVYENGALKVYKDGEYLGMEDVPRMDIQSADISVGISPFPQWEDDFQGCIYGVDIWR